MVTSLPQGEEANAKRDQDFSKLIHLCLFYEERLGVLKMDEACSAKSCPVQSHKQAWR